jgi:flagellar hook-basal body complex protein FliE
MLVNELLANRSYLPMVQQRETSTGNTQNPRAESFTATLREFISDTNALQVESSEATAKMIKGEPVDIHDVMISAQKAKTSFELLLELRNKGLDLYKEVMRIQV